jgi:hypothetical protein
VTTNRTIVGTDSPASLRLSGVAGKLLPGRGDDAAMLVRGGSELKGVSKRVNLVPHEISVRIRFDMPLISILGTDPNSQGSGVPFNISVRKWKNVELESVI